MRSELFKPTKWNVLSTRLSQNLCIPQLSLWKGLQIKTSDNTEIVASSFECTMQVGVLLSVGVYNGSICQNNLHGLVFVKVEKMMLYLVVQNTVTCWSSCSLKE